MSMRYQAGILTASYFPLKVPNAPTAVTATMASSTSVSVAFTAPADVGGGAITGYTVVSSGGHIATGSSSPITVSGLTTGVAYTFVVYANNAFGNSPASAASNSVTPVTQGQQAYTTAGTYSWVAPAGVTSVSVVAVGGGGGSYNGSPNYNTGGGGGLGYKNNITVVPGNSYSVVVGAAGGFISNVTGGDSYFINTSTVKGGGGTVRTGGTYTGDGGGNGGIGGGTGIYNESGGGGGAGGYSGNGGAGGQNASDSTGYAGSSGSGGGGGGGGSTSNGDGKPGGGVGILGQGASGAGGAANAGTGNGGGGGSGGQAGQTTGYFSNQGGGAYGGGGGRQSPGAGGAVRIIWPGTTRSFPSTNTGDV